MVRWGLIGASTIAREWMAPAIAAQPDCVVAAVASSNAARARAFAAEMSIPRHYGAVDELLAESEIEAVYISTTNEWHEQQVIAAARAGKHVLCEKPLALTLDGAQDGPGVRRRESGHGDQPPLAKRGDPSRHAQTHCRGRHRATTGSARVPRRLFARAFTRLANQSPGIRRWRNSRHYRPWRGHASFRARQ